MSARSHSKRQSPQIQAPKRRRSKVDEQEKGAESQLEILAQRLSALQNVSEEEDQDLSPLAWNETSRLSLVETLLRRFEAHEKKTQSSVHALWERLEKIGGILEEKSKNAEKIPETGYRALEEAVRNIVEHIEINERRTRDALKNIYQRVLDLPSTHGQETPSQEQEALKERLLKLAARLESIEKKQKKSSDVSSAIGEMQGKVDVLEAFYKQELRDVNDQVTSRITQEVMRAEVALRDLISQTQETFWTKEHAIDAIGQINEEIATLSEQLEILEKQSCMKSEVEEVRSLVTTLSQQLPKQTSQDRATTEQIVAKTDALEAEMRHLSNLQALQQHTLQQKDQTRAVQKLQEQMLDVENRLDTVEEKLIPLEGLEKTVEELCQFLAQKGDEGSALAEEAAQKVGDYLVQQGIVGPLSPGKSVLEQISLLENGLETLKTSSQEVDVKTQEILGSIYETLEQVVAKISNIETNKTKNNGDTSVAHLSPEATETIQKEQHISSRKYFLEVPEAEKEPLGSSLAWWKRLISDQKSKEQSKETSEHKPSIGDALLPEDSSETSYNVLPFDRSSGKAPPFLKTTTAASLSLKELPEWASSTSRVLEKCSDFEPTKQETQGLHDDFINAVRRAARTTPPAQPLEAAPSGEDLGLANAANANQDIFSEALTTHLLEEQPSLSQSLSGVRRGLNFSEVVEPPSFLSSHLARIIPQNFLDTKQSNQSIFRKKLVVAGLVLLAIASAYVINARRPTEAPAALDPPPRVSSSSNQEAAPIVQAPAASQSTTRIFQKSSDPVTTASLGNIANASKSQDRISGGEGARPNSDATLASLEKKKAEQATLQSLISTPAISSSERLSLLKKASGGDKIAQFVLATSLFEGRLGIKDVTKAAYWYQKAADQGFAPAQYRLGTLYEQGQGVAQNWTFAKQFYEKAALQGNIRAMHNLAVLYAGSHLGTPNLKDAFTWFSKASEYGLKDSQYNLAVFYERGLGIPQDKEKAFFFYSLAAKQGDPDARARLLLLQPQIAAKLPVINRQIWDWKVKPAIEEANVVAVSSPQSALPVSDPSVNVLAQEKNSTNPSELAPLGPLSEESLIKRVQERLSKLGFDAGKTDGKMGAQTANAIRLFQLRSGLPINGRITPDLIERLSS